MNIWLVESLIPSSSSTAQLNASTERESTSSTTSAAIASTAGNTDARWHLTQASRRRARSCSLAARRLARSSSSRRLGGGGADLGAGPPTIGRPEGDLKESASTLW